MSHPAYLPISSGMFNNILMKNTFSGLFKQAYVIPVFEVVVTNKLLNNILFRSCLC